MFQMVIKVKIENEHTVGTLRRSEVTVDQRQDSQMIPKRLPDFTTENVQPIQLNIIVYYSSSVSIRHTTRL